MVDGPNKQSEANSITQPGWDDTSGLHTGLRSRAEQPPASNLAHAAQAAGSVEQSGDGEATVLEAVSPGPGSSAGP